MENEEILRYINIYGFNLYTLASRNVSLQYTNIQSNHVILIFVHIF
jgi:hypothetical protein